MQHESIATPSTPTITQQNKFLTISNLVSISRVLLVIPFVLVMSSESSSSTVWGVIILAIGALTDKLDGVLARKLNQITEWGKILDPLADKIAVAAVAVVLLYLDRIPLWFVFPVVGRDVLIFSGGMYLKASKGIVLPSNEAGKWAVGVITLTLFFALVSVGSPVLHISIAGSIVMLAVSLYLYLWRFVQVMRNSRRSPDF